MMILNYVKFNSYSIYMNTKKIPNKSRSILIIFMTYLRP